MTGVTNIEKKYKLKDSDLEGLKEIREPNPRAIERPCRWYLVRDVEARKREVEGAKEDAKKKKQEEKKEKKKEKAVAKKNTVTEPKTGRQTIKDKTTDGEKATKKRKRDDEDEAKGGRTGLSNRDEEEMNRGEKKAKIGTRKSSRQAATKQYREW